MTIVGIVAYLATAHWVGTIMLVMLGLWVISAVFFKPY